MTLALHPLVVTTHLLGGFAILTLLWLSGRIGGFPFTPVPAPGAFPGGSMACGVLLLQIALGGWTSANYAAMGVSSPWCQGSWQAELNWAQAFHLPWGTPGYEFGVLGRRRARPFTSPIAWGADHGLAGGGFRPRAALPADPPERVWLVVAGSADRADCLGIGERPSGPAAGQRPHTIWWPPTCWPVVCWRAGASLCLITPLAIPWDGQEPDMNGRGRALALCPPPGARLLSS